MVIAGWLYSIWNKKKEQNSLYLFNVCWFPWNLKYQYSGWSYLPASCNLPWESNQWLLILLLCITIELVTQLHEISSLLLSTLVAVQSEPFSFAQRPINIIYSSLLCNKPYMNILLNYYLSKRIRISLNLFLSSEVSWVILDRWITKSQPFSPAQALMLFL